MKRTDPASDLAERSIRQWQISESKAVRHDLTKKTEVITAQVREAGGVSTFTVGSVAGFLGAITSLICNIAGALVLGVEPLRLLRIYATILEGRGIRWTLLSFRPIAAGRQGGRRSWSGIHRSRAWDVDNRIAPATRNPERSTKGNSGK